MIATPLRLRITTPHRTSVVTVPFDMVPDELSMANAETVDAGPLNERDRLVLEVLAPDRDLALIETEVIAPAGGNGVFPPGAITIAVEDFECCCCTECPCC